ncbi:MAG TPA: polysaccharide deacetylase family protein [Chloroflexi bacterium]|nr:polysaccharide deacetylase family protein [Chloroflexota bacterium]
MPNIPLISLVIGSIHDRMTTLITRAHHRGDGGDGWPASIGRFFLRLGIITFVLCALAVTPAQGRWDIPYWDIPQTASMADPSSFPSSPLPTPTPVTLPEEAHVPILMYHYVSELPPDADSLRRDLTVSPEDFEAQLAYLAEAGYHPITLTDLTLYLTQGYPLPDKPVILTFDDGYADAYTVVFPLLLKYGFPGTFFVLATPTHFESPGYMTWKQMKEMSEAGMDIQAHGRDHVDLRGRSYDYLVYQIVGAQEAIQYHTGRLPRFFCYPSGRYDADVIAVLKSAGYWGAVTTEWGYTHTRDNLFMLPRIRIRGSDTLESFVEKLEWR